MIYDCFSFFNELDLLEIRFRELDSVVDKFVLIEADKTFRGNPKPFYFEENKERFSKWKDKIIHVKHNFENEVKQKNSLMAAFGDLNSQDFIIFGDIDELAKSEKVLESIKIFEDSMVPIDTVTFGGNMYVYSLNGLRKNADGTNNLWLGSAMFTKGFFENTGQQNLVYIRDVHRPMEDFSHIRMLDAGWHFSYLGDKETIKTKISEWTHWNDFEDKDKDTFLEDCINNGKYLYPNGSYVEYVAVDDSFPKTIKDYEHLIHE